jgi:uncharacterized protein YoxC
MMELVTVIFQVGVGIGIVLIGVAAVIFAVGALPLLRETRALAADSRRIAAITERELQPLLSHAREVAQSAEVLSEDVAVKLDRLNDLMNSLQHTLETVRITAAPGRVAFGSIESANAREDDRF